MKNSISETQAAQTVDISILWRDIYVLAASAALAALTGALPAIAQTAPTGVVADQNIPVIAATVSGPSNTYLLNLDESVS